MKFELKELRCGNENWT